MVRFERTPLQRIINTAVARTNAHTVAMLKDCIVRLRTNPVHDYRLPANTATTAVTWLDEALAEAVEYDPVMIFIKTAKATAGVRSRCSAIDKKSEFTGENTLFLASRHASLGSETCAADRSN